MRTVALTATDYESIVRTIRAGYTHNGITHEPNPRTAAALTIQANLGLRIGDVLCLRLACVVRDGERWRLDITEQKTGKTRTFTVPDLVLDFMRQYAQANGIGDDATLFPLSVRAVQKSVHLAAEHLNLDGIGTHSFRKFFATEIYVSSGYNIQLVSTLLQHSSAAITQRYIGIQQKDIEQALQQHVHIVR